MTSTENASHYPPLDALSPLASVSLMLDAQEQALESIRPTLPTLAAAAVEAAKRLGETGRLVYVGAGTSGRIAVQDGVELHPTFRWPNERLAFVLAGGEAALLKSVEGAEDDDCDARAQMQRLQLTAQDVVIGVAASGQTPFTVAALVAARAAGALTIGLANNADSRLARAVDYALQACTGAECVAGSTRMKAGSAQKVLLNTLSTQIMVQLHRVFEGRMVDMIASNKKLRQRALIMLQELTACDAAQALQYLEAAHGHIKVAILLAHGRTVEQAQQQLAATQGDLRQALTLAKSA